MSRPSSITPEQVFAAAFDLRDRGQTVTVQAVRQVLGTGRFTTVARLALLLGIELRTGPGQPLSVPATPL